ncbi:substrate-binding domain-containing protein [Actinomadura sp. 7K507]|uniref:substrate-binding domain-containing protein n=1 Tax=Actinomadura sp. 7K507 TaxID=2530365 RepID=UPI0010531D4C|nr:substrate-binding domain-containing protein [Actinomadura sp. 7K507]TDC84499.1 ABC transporter substrate-binding protein [Actinomadura sp. 7K507]
MNLWRRPAAWAAAALLLTGVGSGAWALGLLPGTTSCGGSTLRITIAAQPEIAPALSDVADRFNVEEHRVGGRCVDAHVTAISPTGFMGDAALRAKADAWVPESSLWLELARDAGDTSVPPAGSPVATTPVVLATTHPVEAEFRDADLTIGWELLRKDEAGGFGLARAVPDPRTGMSGTIAMIAIDQVTEGQTDDADDADDVAEALRDNAPGRPDATSGASTAVLADLTGAERSARPLAVTTEQAVVAYNDTHRPNPIVGFMPDEGTLTLDHPYVVTTKNQNRQDAADAFKAALGTGSARDTLQRAGFRAPDGTLTPAYADEHDLPETAPPSLRVPTRKEIDKALKSWEA